MVFLLGSRFQFYSSIIVYFIPFPSLPPMYFLLLFLYNTSQIFHFSCSLNPSHTHTHTQKKRKKKFFFRLLLGVSRPISLTVSSLHQSKLSPTLHLNSSQSVTPFETLLLCCFFFFLFLCFMIKKKLLFLLTFYLQNSYFSLLGFHIIIFYYFSTFQIIFSLSLIQF